MSSLKLGTQLSARNGVIAAVVLIVRSWLAVAATRTPGVDKLGETGSTKGGTKGAQCYPTIKAMGVDWHTVTEVVNRTEHLTEGKIAVDEDRSTLVFSPYSGRVIKLLAKPGDSVKAGQPLFTVEAPDMVQAQNDFIAAISNLNKSKSALELAKIVEQQNKTLYDSRAGPLRDLQTSQAARAAATGGISADRSTSRGP